ncbi:MAG: hypothetical protein UI647_09960 [Negativibacillus sp.]
MTEMLFANFIQLNGTETGNKKEDKYQQKTGNIFKEKRKGIGKPKVCQQQNTGSGNGRGKAQGAGQVCFCGIHPDDPFPVKIAWFKSIIHRKRGKINRCFG